MVFPVVQCRHMCYTCIIYSRSCDFPRRGRDRGGSPVPRPAASGRRAGAGCAHDSTVRGDASSGQLSEAVSISYHPQPHVYSGYDITGHVSWSRKDECQSDPAIRSLDGILLGCKVLGVGTLYQCYLNRIGFLLVHAPSIVLERVTSMSLLGPRGPASRHAHTNFRPPCSK